jgi:FkbM family methyltransferase
MLMPMRELPFRGITGAIHIGAHKAEELDDYLESGINRILWVEANMGLHSEIEKAISSFPLMRLGRFAAGDEDRLGELRITNDSQSTSILKLNTHAIEYPHIVELSKVQVQIKQIDTWMEEIGAERNIYNLLNLDIQGYELKALRGCAEQLRYIEYIYTEVNKQELYRECASYVEIDEFLACHGFRRVATVWCRHGWGDALYSRKNHKWLPVRVRLALAKRYLLLKKEKLIAYAVGFLKPNRHTAD